MKYAITGPAGRIFKVLDAATDGSVEITDEQAATVNSSEEPLFLVEGELKTIKEKFVAAMSPEAKAAYEAARNPVPVEMSSWQARAILEIEGLLGSVEAFISDLPDDASKIIIKSAWNNNATFERSSPTINTIAIALGLTDEQVDNLFRAGSALVV